MLRRAGSLSMFRLTVSSNTTRAKMTRSACRSSDAACMSQDEAPEHRIGAERVRVMQKSNSIRAMKQGIVR